MSSTEMQESVSWGLENDLSSLACRAAIELDNLILGRTPKLYAVRQLAEKISKSVLEKKEAIPQDPATVVMMKCAIQDSHWSTEPLKKVEDLIKEAQIITNRLTHLAQSEGSQAQGDDPDPRKLRLFCLTLSRLALGSERPWGETRPDHPFRR